MAGSNLTPEQRSMRARHAALVRWSKEDPKRATLAARRGQLKRFENLVDPERTLDPAERARRVEAAQRAHMTKLSYQASKAASARRKGKAA